MRNTSPYKLDHRFAVHRQRFTVGLPEGQRKTLIDLWEPGLVLRWSEQSLADVDGLKGLFQVRTTEKMDIDPDLPPGWRRTYKRLNNLPVLHMEYRGREGKLSIDVAGGRDADMIKLSFTSVPDTQAPLRVIIRSDRAWCDPKNPALLRDDGSVFCYACGHDDWCLSWFGHRSTLRIGLRPDARTAWVIVPHGDKLTSASCWADRDWPQEWADCVGVWRKRMARSVRFRTPDRKILSAYKSCLSDLFLLREPLADGGGMGALAGTSVYRAVSTCEINVHVQALLRAGYPDAAWENADVLLPLQSDNGRWDDFTPWLATFWSVNGAIPLLFRELFRFTGSERAPEIYPRLLKLARWIETARAESKSLPSDDPRFGLMPPGYGDGGLCRDLNACQAKGPYHVFFVHNAWNVGGLRITSELAREFGTPEEADELRAAYEDAQQCLVNSMERCAVSFEGGRYVPASTDGEAGGGSLWRCTAFAHPSRLVPYDHPLVLGTLAWFEAGPAPTGIRLNTGWQPHGMWPGGVMGDPAPLYLRRGDVDKLTALVYAALNHGSPMWTWPEERHPGAGTSLSSGDPQEAWFPGQFCQLFRDMFLYEDDAVLHLAAGIPRFWYESGPVGVSDGPSHFGPVSYTIECDLAAGMVEVHGSAGAGAWPCTVILHLNLPGGGSVARIDADGRPDAELQGDRILFNAAGDFRFRLHLK